METQTHEAGRPERRRDGDGGGHSVTPVVETFMTALVQVESAHALQLMVDLFTDDAELSNLGRPLEAKGRVGAWRFWEGYLAQFRDIHSKVTRVIEADDAAALEWRAVGQLPNGHPIRYTGVTVLTLNAGKIRRFRSYYDSAAFLTRHG